MTEPSASPGEAPALAVVIPSLNGADGLIRAAESVLPQLSDDDELIVVDNGSDHEHAEAIAEWARGRERVRLVVEPRRSVSVARNTASALVTAPIVLFMDDDEIAPPGWVASYRRSWSRAGPAVGALGGPYEPVWGETGRPEWLTDRLLTAVSINRYGDARRRLAEPWTSDHLYGGNMAVRLEALNAVGGFDPKIGPRAEAPFSRGEERDLQERLHRAGWEIWFDPDLVLEHHIAENRLTKEYFRAYFAFWGLEDVARAPRRFRAAAQLVRSSIAWALRRLRGDPEAFASELSVILAWSRLSTLGSLARRLER